MGESRQEDGDAGAVAVAAGLYAQAAEMVAL